MIRIPEIALAPQLLERLAGYQGEIDRVAAFDEKVATAKAAFSAANVKGNVAFDAIKIQLDRMCSGARRCMYCEDSAADEVEHFKPKTFYPELTFLWENYLYACGPCNIAKREKFAVRAASGEIKHLERKPKETPVAPPVGESIAVNPRSEDPLEFIILDIAGDTFVFAPLPDAPERDAERAFYTVDLLKLNRDVLVRARREAFKNLKLRLQEYIAIRDAGAPHVELSAIVTSLVRMQHPSVWREMCRQRRSISLLNVLFERAPEALGW